ncbi:MAG: cytochrome C [Desulfovibrio sp.]|nr:MAG: cytochrome C [Desulfovibrio sp.]
MGGGLFLVLTEMFGRRAGNQAVLDYVKKHTKFFLLLTMVFGSLTGVAIWFVIQLISPAATSTLIHTFVFGWATEWVFFLGEIVSLLVYYYYFTKMRARDHLIVGWLYFGFAWLSLFMINGIIGFMLTPGAWIETQNFWDGFFNPSFWPALAFRSFMAFTFAGLFGFVTSTRIEDPATRKSMVRYTALWVLIPFVFLMASGYWYLMALPGPQQAMIMAKSTEIQPFFMAFLIISPLVVVGALVMAIGMPRAIGTGLALILLVLGLMQIGSFEWVREAGRRPFVIRDYCYSSNVLVRDVETFNEQGLLASTGWSRFSEITEENELEAGRELFGIQCLPCHSIGGPMLDIRDKTRNFGLFGMNAQLTGQGVLREHMPPFVGTDAEREALALYIVQEINGQDLDQAEYEAPQLEHDVPPFDGDSDEYVLLAWNNLGMHCISDSDPYWILLPPANDLYAVLIYRDMFPEIVTQDVVISYQVEEGFERPADHVRFWEFAHILFGMEEPLPPNVGVSGNAMSGEMVLHEELGAFEATLVPVVPYPDQGGFNPYPIFTIQAHDANTGDLLAETRMVAPTSTEMGCRNCHGGEWRVEVDGVGVAGFSDETAANILEAHDRINGTTLLADAEAGQPRLCQSCHPDPVLNAEGEPGVLSFPAAIHGWHANYLTGQGTEVCFSCHPASTAGGTGCLRGVHDERGLDCTSCHGYLEDHALSLLKKEHELGKASAAPLMANLTPRLVDSVDDINARTPWLMEPDCLSCHEYGELPDIDTTAFNKWTSGDPNDLYRLRLHEVMNIPCEACHGSTHAVYPAYNIYGADRDNIGPLQYQGFAGPIGDQENCAVCHLEELYEPSHY